MTGVQITGCSTSQSSGATPEASARSTATSSSGKRSCWPLLQAGRELLQRRTHHLKTGDTEVLARMISERIECDVHRIEAVNAYFDDYDETVARNVHEQKADARPVIANPRSTIGRYDVVVLGSPSGRPSTHDHDDLRREDTTFAARLSIRSRRTR